jgi:hypothetical protein
MNQNSDGTWWVSWQDDDGLESTDVADWDAALAWVRERSAENVLVHDPSLPAKVPGEMPGGEVTLDEWLARH